MIVSESSVAFSSQHTAVSEYRLTESIDYWRTDTNGRNPSGGDRASSDTTNMTTGASSVKVSLSRKSIEQSSSSKKTGPEESEEILADLNLRILRALIERLTGRKILLNKDVSANASSSEAGTETPPPAGAAGEGASGPGFGLEYKFEENYHESEKSSFAARGQIVTSMGERVDFDLQISMAREFQDQRSMHIRMGEALKDPLVVNFSGTSAELLDTVHSFDIDADGDLETISHLSAKSGFLALDRNEDGVVSDGSELFGALTGNGFEELARYDSDQNGWIDENDAIFVDLRIWVKDGERDEMTALETRGVGAIYLGSIATPFELKNEENVKLGQVRSSGIYLAEDYSVGSVQQIDLVI